MDKSGGTSVGGDREETRSDVPEVGTTRKTFSSREGSRRVDCEESVGSSDKSLQTRNLRERVGRVGILRGRRVG